MFFIGLSLGPIGRDAKGLLGTSKSVADVIERGASGGIVEPSSRASMLAALIATGFAIRRRCGCAPRRPPAGSSRCSPPRSRAALGRRPRAVALGGSAVVLAATGLGAGIGTQDVRQIPRLMGAALARARRLGARRARRRAVRARPARRCGRLGRARRLRAAVLPRPAARASRAGSSTCPRTSTSRPFPR